MFTIQAMIASYLVRKIINCIKWLGIHVDNKVQMFTRLIVEFVFIKVKLLKVLSSSIVPMICTTTNSTTFMNLLDMTHNNALVKSFIHNQDIGLGFICWYGPLCIRFHGYIENENSKSRMPKSSIASIHVSLEPSFLS